jgi:hypothetical protein
MIPRVRDTVNSEDLIAYLLHETTEEERLAFSEKWISDADLHEQLRMMEAELLDAYVREDVGPERRRRIEMYLLNSERQQEKLALARALHDELPRVRRAIPWAPVAAAASILVLAGGTLWLVRENGSLRREVLEARVDLQRQRPAGSTLAVTLPADAIRGAVRETSIAIPSGAEVVRLELELEPGDQSQSATVEVSLAGRVIWSQNPIEEQARGGTLVATVWIPAGFLTPGRYEVKLSSDGSALAYYHFSINPPGGR